VWIGRVAGRLQAWQQLITCGCKQHCSGWRAPLSDGRVVVAGLAVALTHVQRVSHSTVAVHAGKLTPHGVQ
jgi:hypothetical protein